MPEAAYTTGNLGKGRPNLTLVPHRVTVTNSGTTSFSLAADRRASGRHAGYDVLSAPVINDSLSTGVCAVSSGPESILTPGVGGTAKSIYRIVTITNTGTNKSTCVLDYYQRLALGSYENSGSSLHANLLNVDLTPTAGVGASDVSIPVRQIEPQKLDKTMTAKRGQDSTGQCRRRRTPRPSTSPIPACLTCRAARGT